MLAGNGNPDPDPGARPRILPLQICAQLARQRADHAKAEGTIRMVIGHANAVVLDLDLQMTIRAARADADGSLGRSVRSFLEGVLEGVGDEFADQQGYGCGLRGGY